MTADTSSLLAGSDRFVVRRQIGAGAFGVVYEAYDRERDLTVAVKALRQMAPEALYRFKREFRTLADLVHPNLVTLHELLTDGPQWFFTMELVLGSNVVAHVREPHSDDYTPRPTPSLPPVDAAETRLAFDISDGSSGIPDAPAAPGGRVDVDRIRHTFYQLGEALRALHEHGIVHRDIKPSNVLVTPEGRVVVLDFGLVSDRDRQDPSASTGVNDVMGTPAYMSPEQAAGGTVSAAADWYAVGVMLYQALTGQVPFTGSSLQVLLEKQHGDAVPPQRMVPDLPSDLCALAMMLLEREPDRRAGYPEIMATLSPAGAGPPGPIGFERRFSERFVGRHAEQRLLREALAEVERGLTVSVFVDGQSGMGKTALVRNFLQEARRQDRHLTVLSGRCYANESVPYKGFDSAIDALSQFLRQQPSATVDVLLPRDVAALTRVFPVLRRVDAIASARGRFDDIADPRELRRRAFSALRELLGRLAERHSLILFIDDMQWGDLDSIGLIEELLRAPDPPPLLLIVAYRSDEAESSPPVARLLAAEKRGHFGRVRHISVRELDMADVRQLVAAMSRTGDAADAERIARETGGSPFFIREILRQSPDGRALPADSPRTLDELVLARVRRLPEDAAHVLHLIALSGRPLPIDVLSRACDTDSPVFAVLGGMQKERLIRMRDTGAAEKAVEVYHDRIRETVVALLRPDVARTLHLRLAAALKAAGASDPEALGFHLRAAGDLARAAGYIAAAADRAAHALAFDRAARLYREARASGRLTREEEQRVTVRLASALANAGRGAEAADEYLAAAEVAATADALDLQRRAAEQLLISGHIDRGLGTLQGLMRQTRLRLAATPARALPMLALRRAYLRLRGLGFRERPADQIAPDTLVRLDMCWSVAVGLGLVETIRAAELQARHLLYALRVGEPYRVARALAVEAGYSALHGRRSHRRTERILSASMALAERLDHPHALGLATLTAGIAANLEQRWTRSLELTERAEQILRNRCTGVAWELATAQHNLLRNLLYLGRWRELASRLPPLLQDARERGDLYLATGVRTRMTYIAHLIADRPDIAAAEVEEALAAWSQQGFHLEHYWASIVQPEIELYRGRPARAKEILADRWRSMRTARFLSIESALTEALYLRARIDIAAALSPGTSAGAARSLLGAAARSARRLERQDVAVASALASLLQAAVAAAGGNAQDAVVKLSAAERQLEAVDMPLHAAAARYARGRAMAGDQGAALVASALDVVRREAIVNPERVACMLCPGPWDARGPTGDQAARLVAAGS